MQHLRMLLTCFISLTDLGKRITCPCQSAECNCVVRNKRFFSHHFFLALFFAFLKPGNDFVLLVPGSCFVLFTAGNFLVLFTLSSRRYISTMSRSGSRRSASSNSSSALR